MSKFNLLKKPSTWRRLSMATWGTPNDPTVYGYYPLDATAVLAFVQEYNKKSTIKITPTHVLTKAVALTLARYPDLNGIIRLGRIYLRNSVDIFLQVAMEAEHKGEKPDLSGAKIENCDQKTLEEIARELQGKSQQIRQKQDPQFKKTTSLLDQIPSFFLPWTLKIIDFLVYTLDLDLKAFGIPYDPFGSAMITSVGPLKAPSGLAPLVPMSRCPLIVCVGEVRKRPWVVNDEVLARPILDLSVTFDHRFMDGLTGSKMARYLAEIIENPELHL